MALPDELIRDEVFRCLHNDGDVFALLRCAATCKGWRHLVASSSILRRRWPSPLIGFFTRQCHVTWLPGTSPTDVGAPLAFVPTGRTAAVGLGGTSSPSFRRLSSFIRDAPDSLDGGVPLTSRGTLLLVRLLLDHQDMEPCTRLRLAVCDMLAGTCHMLPELLDCDSRFTHYGNSYGYAILSSRAGDQRYNTDDGFRVLIISQDKNEASYYNLHVFMSDKLSWRTPLKCFITVEHEAWSMMHAAAVVCRGYAHWLFSNMSNFLVLNVDIKTGRVSLTKLVTPTPARWINVPGDHVANAMDLYLNSFAGLSKVDRLTTTAHGSLLTLCVRHSDGRRLEIWTQQHADGEQSAEWLYTRVIELKLFDLDPRPQHPTCICLGERSGRLLIVDGRCRMYIADLETGALEDVTNEFQGHAYNHIVPMEIDWPRFPAWLV